MRGRSSTWVIAQVDGRSFNPLPHNDDFRRTGGKKPFENIVGKEEMLGTSIFFFSHNVFCPMKHEFNVLSCRLQTL